MRHPSKPTNHEEPSSPQEALAGIRLPSGLVGLVLMVLATAAFAQNTDEDGGIVATQTTDEVEYFADINDELLKVGSALTDDVVSSTKTAQRGAQTPAVITVITADEIEARGYRSLAEILRTVPGFYDVYDGVTHNVGIRGINGGAQASGSVVKLMIDGHPVDYRPSTGNFFGEELIPLPAISRIEIIRGPGSAVYGANAFLGVINIISKTGLSAGKHVTASMNLIREHPGFGLGAVVGFGTPDADIILAGSYSYYDRSGLNLPASSPILNSRDDVTRGRLVNEGQSANDVSRPKSFFGKASINALRGKVTLTASLQNLDSFGEFQEFGPMSHSTRITLLNQNYRLQYDVQPHERLTLSFAAFLLTAGPTGEGRNVTSQQGQVRLTREGVLGYGATTEAQLKIGTRWLVTLGADLSIDDHHPLTFDTLLTNDVRDSNGNIVQTAGTVLPGDNQNRLVRFTNLGALLQVLVNWNSDWSAVAGGRVDVHNIYGPIPSFRLGIVYAPVARPLSLKLLYGSSFKPPSAEQLFAVPMDFLGLIGNPNLTAQTAHTVELAVGYGFGDGGEVLLNLFATDIIGRVEFLQKSNFLQAQNIGDEWVVGGELDARYAVTKRVRFRLMAGVAHTIARSERSTIRSDLRVTNPLYPTANVHLIGDYTLPFLNLQLSTEVSYVSQRVSSQLNSLLAGSVTVMPGYFYGAASLSARYDKLFGKETRLVLRVSDIFNSQWSDSGFVGVDVPSQGITAMFIINQQF